LNKEHYNKLIEGSNEHDFATCKDNTILLEAGPGTGKSHALLARIEYFVCDMGMQPEQFLVLTYNRAAADSLREDLNKDSQGRPITVKTLHQYCFDWRTQKGFAGNGRPWRFISEDSKEAHIMVKDLSVKLGHAGVRELLKSYISSLDGMSEFDCIAHSDFIKSLDEWLEVHRAGLYAQWMHKVLAEMSEVGFDQSASFVLVDEYQDFNALERAIIDLIAAGRQIVVMGDEDQSIYSFRQATIGWTAAFKQAHPTHTCFTFNTCWHCPKKVLAGASGLIQNNPRANRPELKSADIVANGKVHKKTWPSFAHEISGISDLVCSRIDGIELTRNDVCILVPNRRIASRLQTALQNRCEETGQLVARIYSNNPLIDSFSSMELFARLLCLADENDNYAWRLLLCEKTGSHVNYRESLIVKLYAYMGNNISITEALENIKSEPQLLRRSSNLIARYEQVQQQLNLLKDTFNNNPEGFLDELFRDAPRGELWAHLQEAANIHPYTNFASLQDWLSILRDHLFQNANVPNANSPDHIRIMTIFASKGLSARLVVILIAIQGVLPSAGSDMNESRRLFYIALTRCNGVIKDGKREGELIISYPTALTKDDLRWFPSLANQAGGACTPSEFIAKTELVFDNEAEFSEDFIIN